MSTLCIIILLIIEKGLTVNNEEFQSFLSSSTSLEISKPRQDPKDYPLDEYLALPVEVLNFLEYLQSKITLIEPSVYTQYQSTLIENSDALSDVFSSLCSNLSQSDYQITLSDIKDYLEVYDLVLIPDTAFHLEDHLDQEEDLDYFPDNEPEDLDRIKSKVLDLLSTLKRNSILISSSSFNEQPLITPKTVSFRKSLLSLPSLNFSTPQVSKILSKFNIMIQGASQNLRSEGLCPDSPYYSKSNAQLIANNISDMRQDYTDSEGVIILNAEDLETEIDKYQELISQMPEGAVVLIGKTLTDISHAKEDLLILQKALEKIEGRNRIIVINDEEATISATNITNSENMTTVVYEKKTEASLNFTESIPIVGTMTFSDEITNQDGSQLVENNISSLNTDENLKLTQEEVMKIEKHGYLLLSTFNTDKEGTGKIWVLPLEDPSNIYLLLEGLKMPISVCFDLHHSFLYVVDNTEEEGSIFQYKVSINDKLEIENEFYIKVYSGNPVDCKVDLYGNLYFTDQSAKSINIITYADLFSGFRNAFFTIYSYETRSSRIKKPGKFVFSSSGLIIFANKHGAKSSINYAPAEVESLNQEKIRLLINRKENINDVSYGSQNICYSIETGKVSCFSLYKMKDELIKFQNFINPQGLCFNKNKLYVADHGDGMIYRIDLQKNTSEIIASVQAAFGLFCLQDYGKIVSLSLLAFL